MNMRKQEEKFKYCIRLNERCNIVELVDNQNIDMRKIGKDCA